MKKLFFLVLSLVSILILMDVKQVLTVMDNTTSPPAHKPDVISYYFRDFTLRSHTATTGALRYQVEGQHLKHWQAQQISQITKPVIQSFNEQATAVEATIQADEALLKRQANQIELIQTVIVTSLVPTPMTLSTDQLTINLNNNHITTERPVLFKTDSATLQGVGMELKLDEAYLRLHANVQSTYPASF